VADNIKTTKAINDLLAARQKVIQGTNQELTKQVALQRDLCNAIECADTDTFENLRNSTKDAAQAAKEAEEAYKDTGAELDAMGKQASITHRALQKLGGTLKGFVKFAGVGIIAVVGLLSTFYKKYVGSMHTVIAQLERVQEAQEQVRGKFGSLTSGPGQMVIKDARAMGNAFAKMGVSAGYGYDATINLINKMSELYGSMNPAQMAGLSAMTEESRIKMGEFALAADLSGEEIIQLNNTFNAMGEDGVAAMTDIAVRSHRLEKTLGITSKSANKAFHDMTRNVKAFGNASRAQMESAMSKATQLGISIKDLSGISDAFFTFDKAAEGVSKLSQAFGTQIDVMKMVGAATPADQLDQMREAMFKAGKSAETMSRHELALLAQTSGLSEEAARLAFSQESQYMSQEELNKRIGDTDPQKQMADAMKDVAEEIQNVVIRLSDLVGQRGPLGSFIHGIAKGMGFFGEEAQKSSTEFRKTIMAIFDGGVKLGEWLRKNFAPLRDLFEGTDSALGKTPSIFKKLGNAIKAMVAPLNTAYYLFKAFFIEDDPAKRGEIFDEMLNQISLSFKTFGDKMFGAGGAGVFGEKIGNFFELAIRKIMPRVLDMTVKFLSFMGSIIKDWWDSSDNQQKMKAGAVGLGLAVLAGAGQALSFALGAMLALVKGALKTSLKLLGRTVSWGIRNLIWAPIKAGFKFIARNIVFIVKKFPLAALVIGAIAPVIGLFKDLRARFEEVARSSDDTTQRIFNGLAQLPGMLWDLTGRVAEWGMNFVNILTLGMFSDQLNTKNFKQTWDTFTYELKEVMMAGLSWVGQAGISFWDNFKEGLSTGFREIGRFIEGKLGFLRGFFPQSEPKRGPLRGLAKSGLAMFKNFGKGIKQSIAKITGPLNSFVDALNPLNNIRALAEKFLSTFQFFASVLNQVENLFDNRVQGSVDIDAIAGKIANIGLQISEMNKAMADTGVVELQTKVEDILGTGMFGEDSFSSSSGLVVNLNVTMDADKVAEVLVRERLVVGV